MVGSEELAEGLARMEEEVAVAVGEVRLPIEDAVKDRFGRVYDPVRGWVRPKDVIERVGCRDIPVDGETGVRLYDDRLTPLYRPIVWRDPVGAKVDDRKTRLLLTSTGALLCGVLNHWGRWLVPGFGVVDPIAYAEIKRPKDEEIPWARG